jgi:hypothetical protein
MIDFVVEWQQPDRHWIEAIRGQIKEDNVAIVVATRFAYRLVESHQKHVINYRHASRVFVSRKVRTANIETIKPNVRLVLIVFGWLRILGVLAVDLEIRAQALTVLSPAIQGRNDQETALVFLELCDIEDRNPRPGIPHHSLIMLKGTRVGTTAALGYLPADRFAVMLERGKLRLNVWHTRKVPIT